MVEWINLPQFINEKTNNSVLTLESVCFDIFKLKFSWTKID